MIYRPKRKHMDEKMGTAVPTSEYVETVYIPVSKEIYEMCEQDHDVEITLRGRIQGKNESEGENHESHSLNIALDEVEYHDKDMTEKMRMDEMDRGYKRGRGRD